MAEARETGEFRLLGGQLSLDFANTLEWRGSARERDWLTGYEALVAWALRAGALDRSAAEELRAYADWAPGSAAEVAAEARRLRAAIYRVAAALAAGEAAAGEDLEALNAALAPLLAETRLTAQAEGPEPGRLMAVWGGAADDLHRVVWPVARAAFDLLSGPESGRLRECAGRDCHWLFLDRSKNGSRRWCAMSNCGNLAKARRHRARNAGAQSQAAGLRETG